MNHQLQRRSVLFMVVVLVVPVLFAFMFVRRDVLGASSYEVLDAQQLYELALKAARTNGLDGDILEQKSALLTEGEWLAANGMTSYTSDPNLPVYVLAIRGDGVWRGIGDYSDKPRKITGITVTLDATTGMPSLVSSTFVDPTVNRAPQVTVPDVIPTLAPSVDRKPKPESTRDASSGDVLPLPAGSN